MTIRLGNAKAFAPKISPRTKLNVRTEGDRLLLEGAYGQDFLNRVELWPSAKPVLKNGRYEVDKDALIGLIEGVDGFDVEWSDEVMAQREALLNQRIKRGDMSRALAPTQAGAFLPQLRPYQQAGVEYALTALADKKGVIIADEMGLGKSITALATMEALAAYPALIACPAGLLANWKAEISGGYGKQGWLHHRTVQIAKTGKDRTLGNADITLASYDSLSAINGIERQWEMMVLDEAHYIRNPYSRRSQRVQYLSHFVKNNRVVLLTGTPLINKSLEIIPQLKVIGRVTEMGGARRFIMLSMKGAEAAHEELRRTAMTRRFRIDALPQLPPKHRDVVPVEVTSSDYSAAERQFFDWLKGKADAEDLEFEDQGRANGHMMTMRRLVGEAKVKWALAWCNDFLADSEDPLVVFTHHETVEGPMASGLSSYGVARISGGDSGKRRMEAIDSLRSKNRVLVASTLAAGVGLDMTMASTALMLELQWTPASLEQAEDRLCRYGQTKPVEVVYPIAAGTVDSRVWDIIWSKNLQVTALSNGKSQEFNVRKMLVQGLRGGK